MEPLTSPGPIAPSPRTDALHVLYRVWTNRAGGETEQPPTKRSPDDARWHFRALDLLTLYETHSSGAIRRERSLLTAPVRSIVVISVVGDLLPTTPVGLDRPDLTIGSGVVDKGYPLT